jgi:hypothetical protein
MEVSDKFHALVVLPQGKNPKYPLDRRLFGPQNRSGHGVEEKNSQAPPGIEPRSPDRPAHNQSLYPGSRLGWGRQGKQRIFGWRIHLENGHFGNGIGDGMIRLKMYVR